MKLFKSFTFIVTLLSLAGFTTVRADAALPAPSQQIALLLPLTGSFSDAGQSILNGFLGAYYLALNHKDPVPAVMIYDTNGTDVLTTYQQALRDGASLVVGPLLKSDVDRLENEGDIDVPTLALNYTTDMKEGPNRFYQFAMATDNEAIAAAQKAATAGLHQAITISPDNAWGNHSVAIFDTAWQAQQGIIVNSANYSNQESFNDAVATVLNINQSQWRKLQLQRLVGIPLNFSPRRRQDIDVIFLNAPNNDAREIVPLLRYYYAGNIPIYATSVVYDGIPHSTRDQDINGVQFPIIPWSIQPTASAVDLQKLFKTLYNTQFLNNNYLYAFGTDAYTLMSRLDYLSSSADANYLGNTGTLTLNDARQVQRGLLWARFVNGVPQLIPDNNENTTTR